MPKKYVTKESQGMGTLKRFKGYCLGISANPVRFSKFQSARLDEDFGAFHPQSVPRGFSGFNVLSSLLIP